MHPRRVGGVSGAVSTHLAICAESPWYCGILLLRDSPVVAGLILGHQPTREMGWIVRENWSRRPDLNG